MNEEDLKARVTQMVKQKKSEAYIKSYIADYRAKMNSPENKAAQEKEDSPQEERVALTVADASEEDILAISIDTDYWAKVKKEQGITRDAVVPGENKEHDEQIAKEEKLAKSVETSGETSEEAIEYSSPDENWGLVKDESGADDYGATTRKLRDAYTRYGFDIKRPYDEDFDITFSGKKDVRVTAENGDVKTFDLSQDTAKQEMDEWMRSRSVDKYADFEKSLEGIAITSDERTKAAEDSGSEFDNFIKETQDLEAAQAWKEGDEPLKNNKYHEQIQYSCSVNVIREFGRSHCDKLMNMKPSDIGKTEIAKGFLGVTTGWKHVNVKGANEFTQARLSIAERAFREGLEDLSPEEKKNYQLTKEDRDKISIEAEGIDKSDPEVKRIATDILTAQKEQGLIAERIADKASIWGTGKVGEFDKDVLEAIGKEKLDSLSKSKKAALGEYQVIKDKHTAIQELFKASGEALKTYDAQGKIDAVKDREFKTQEEVDAAKNEIASIISTHEKLAADYNSKLRNYDLITDAAVKASEKIGNLQVDIDDVGSYTQAVGLEYGLANRMGEALYNAGIDLAQGAVSAGELVIDTAKQGIIKSGHPVMSGMMIAYENSGKGTPSAMEKAHAAVDAYQEKWSSSVYHKQYDDIENASDFGEWFAVMMAGQVPNLALMSVAGPASLYAMGITSTGQKYLDLKAQNKLYAESGGLYGNEYSFEEMFLNATVSGAAEALSEKITLGQVNAAKGVFKGMIKSKGVRAGVAEYLTKNVFTSRALMATGKDLLEEGASEAVATISGNLMDIWSGNRDAGFWDGVEESFVSGVMMSSALKSPTLANHALSAFSSPDTNTIREANLARINELSSALLGTGANRKLHHTEELSEEARELMETELAELTAETTEMLERDIKRVDILTENDKKKLLGLESGKRKIQAQWESVKNDDTLSESEKEAIKDRLNKKMMANEATKAEMLSQYEPNVADIKYSETTMPLKSPDQQFEENIEFAKKHSALYGLEVNDTMSPTEIEAYLLEKGYSEKDAKDGRKSDGFIVGDNIVINREVAMAKDAVTVGSHELLHGILKKAMNVNSDLSTKVISQLKKEIGSQWSVVQQRIDDNYTPEYMEKNPDEYLTLVSDAIGKGEIKYEETVFDKIRDAFNEMGLFKKAGFNKIKFKTGKDVYRFLREYNKSIHKGALSSKIVEATKGEGEVAESGDITHSMTSDQRKAAAKSVKDLGVKHTNKSWRRGGADAAIKDMKDNGYFDALIASKYKVKPVPRDFIEKVYSEITPHIKRFKPEQNDNLFAYINSQIGNKAGNVYNKEYKVDEAMKGAKDIDAKTAEGTPVIQVEAETDADVTSFEEQDMSMQAQSRRAKLAEQGKSESDKYSGLRTELGLEKPMMDKVRNAVMKTFGTKLPDVNSKKFKAALQKAYRTELKKPIQDMIGKGATYDTFLTESFPTVFKFLPKETLLQMERNIDPAKRIFTKSERITKPTEVDKLISDGLLPKDTNRLSGPTLITKLPYPGSKKVMAYFRGQNMENTLGYKVGASTLGTRKDKLAMEMGVELGFDATMETVQTPEVSNRRSDILSLTGQVQAENDVSVIGKQIDRDPGIKFSKSVRKLAPLERKTFYNNLPILSEALKKVNPNDEGAVVQVVKDVYGKHYTRSKATALAKDIAKMVDRYGAIEKRHANLNTKPEQALNEYLTDNVKAAELSLNLAEFLELKDEDGKTLRLAKSFDNVDKINTGRAEAVTVANKLVEKYGKAEALIMLVHASGMYATSSKIGRGNFVVKNGVAVDANNTGDGTQRYQFFEGKKDFNKSVLKEVFGDDVQLTEAGNLKKIQTINGVKIDTSLLAETSKAAIADKDYVGRKKQADTSELVVREIAQHYKDQIENGALDKEDFGMMMMSMASNMQSPLKRAANLGYIFKDKKGKKYKGKLRYEHMIPTNYMVMQLTDAYMNDGNVNLDALFKEYTVAVIPVTMDNILDEVKLTQVMPLSYLVGKSSTQRYYNMSTFGHPDLYAIESLNPKDKSKVYGEAAANTDFSIRDINARSKDSKVMDNAIKMSRSTTKPKGITVLDFDDTLATTKSNVWFTTPSAKGLNFELNPEDFYATLTGPEGTRVMWLNRDKSTRGRGYGLIKVLDIDGKPMGSGSVVNPEMDFKEFLKKTRHQARSGGLMSNPRKVEVVRGVLNAEQFAKAGEDLLAEGVEFNFSEFDKVVDGKTAPLFNKAMKLSEKFGTENMFILTARSPASAKAIKQFLDAQGLKIPLKNITGLGKSEASAKANWIAEKVGEGYNDFYFADDAMQNVKAVKDMLDQFDVKGKVQQARLKFSRSGPRVMSEIISEGETDLSSDLNTILEQTKGVDRKKVFSAAKARKRGKNKGKFKFFVPPSADDFAGLMYAFMGKGKQGEKHHQFFKENLFDPFSKGIRHLNRVKQTVANDMKELRKAMPEVRKKLGKNIPGTEYTHEDAIRVYNWAKAGFDIPGLSETDKQTLINAVENDASLNAFAQGVNSIGNTPGGMVEPDNHWLGGNIALDLKEALDVARGTYLQQWKENKDVLFNEANLNKIEAVYGSNFREALEDSLYRMEFGGNKSRGSGRLLNNFTNWIHGSIGTTMFLNARSAMLQMISNVNFVNWSDNNMVAAAGAFANQKQYWSDVSMIFNSPFLKQRRSGIQTDVNAAELLAQIKDSKNKAKAATAYLLQLGFTPTQIADSFAIATGGATFYRNRIKTYLKEGMTQAEAETKAFEDMMEIAEETQQSTREDKISQQQASPLGKFILAFQNTPMQYNRLIKKAAQDLVNGRGDAKANISRIIYYGGIQNLIFYGLQSALFAALFSDDEEDQLTDKKKERVMNGMVDTLLRGSGMGGAIVATVKNVILKFVKEEEKEQDDNWLTQANHANTLIEALNISPPIGIKARKLYSASQTWDFNRDVIAHMSKTDIDNPVYDAAFSATEAVTNLPLSRLYNKYQNISEALNADNEMWQRIAMFLGWSKWNFGIKNQDVMTAKNEVKEIKAEEREERAAQRKIEREAERAAEEAVIEQGFIEDQRQEREDGKEDITCAAVNKSGKRCGKKVEGNGNYCTIHEEVEQRADNKKVQCSHVKANGDRCKMQTTNKSGKCYYHD
jgi:hypothetical protein